MPRIELRRLYVEPFSGVVVVPLTKGAVAFIDAEDMELVGRWNWHETYGYAIHEQWDGQAKRKTRINMSNLIWEAHNGPLPEKTIVDHINLNRADNRLANLRLANKQQNGWNRGKPSDNTSGYKGAHKSVVTQGHPQPWASCITFRGKKEFLGRFWTAEEAHAAYMKRARELHGAFFNKG